MASDVQLLGELQAGGFREPQWLVRRGETFLQLSELLYRVAEQLNGLRKLDEIAAAVTETTRWRVTPDNVAQIIERKLAPLGLIDSAAEPQPRARERDASPLRISGRRQLIGARFVGGISAVLAPLFSPFAVVPALVLVIGLHVWLYVIHGASESLHLALFTPAGLLVVLGLALCSALFHELGHAAALRYGGGEPGAIGGGFYLVFPTLYTNTSDAYRLGRAGRLRTDLGGVYFHLLFALGVGAIALLSHQPLLLAVVVLIDLEILYQFVPTARLDGYWAVGDALGIPDPLGWIRPRVQDRLVPERQPLAAPAIQRKTAAILAVYLCSSLALISGVIALTIADLPQIAVRIADLLRHHVDLLRTAFNKDEVLAVAALALQVLLLALIAVAICLLVYRASSAVIRALLKWGAGTRRRRLSATALLVSIALATAMVWSTGFYWAPHVPFSLTSGKAPPIGTTTVKIGAYGPVAGPISYRLHPPAGGRYAPQWANCGYYASPVPEALAVHSLARGAIWIAYPPTLSSPERALLHTVATEVPYILISPYRGLRSHIILSAWGHQLAIGSLADRRLSQFIEAFRLSPAAPESGKPCTGGAGTPLR